MSKNQNNLLSNHIVANSDIIDQSLVGPVVIDAEINKDNHGLILATIIER
jgi:hypothetical protein